MIGSRGQHGEVLVVALILVVWLALVGLFLLRWSQQRDGQQLHYRCIPARPIPQMRSLLVKHTGPSRISTQMTVDENSRLVSEVELDEVPEDAAIV